MYKVEEAGAMAMEGGWGWAVEPGEEGNCY